MVTSDVDEKRREEESDFVTYKMIVKNFWLRLGFLPNGAILVEKIFHRQRTRALHVQP